MLDVLKKEVAAKAVVINRDKAPCLFVDFRVSSPNLIWQFNLKKTPNFCLMLKQDEQGEWDLGYESDKEKFKIVAHFDERMDAEESYAVIQKVLAKGGKVKTKHPILRGILYAVAFILFINIVTAVFFGGSFSKTTIGQNETKISELKPTIKTGVPVAADDVLPSNPY